MIVATLCEVRVPLGCLFPHLSGHHHLHLTHKLLLLGLLLGRRQLVIREARLLAARHPSPAMR